MRFALHVAVNQQLMGHSKFPANLAVKPVEGVSHLKLGLTAAKRAQFLLLHSRFHFSFAAGISHAIHTPNVPLRERVAYPQVLLSFRW